MSSGRCIAMNSSTAASSHSSPSCLNRSQRVWTASSIADAPSTANAESSATAMAGPLDVVRHDRGRGHWTRACRIAPQVMTLLYSPAHGHDHERPEEDAWSHWYNAKI